MKRNHFNIKLTNRLVLIIALIVFALNQLPFLLDMRPVMYDEPWYMNPAYNLLNGKGLVNDLVGSGGNVNNIAPMIMAGFMALFGTILLVARCAAVCCGFVAVVILHLIMNELNVNKWARGITYGVFLSISIINSVFRYVRPEFAVALFVLIGLLFACRYHRTHSCGDAVGLTIFIYVASCSHPYALYLFALIGCTLLWDVICTKDWKRMFHMMLFVLSAILVIVSLIYVNRSVNAAVSSDAILHRFSIVNALEAMCVSMKHVFIKHGVYTFLFLIINIYALVKYKEIRWLVIPNVVFVFTFPILFSSDLNMVGNNALYFSIISIVLSGYVINRIVNNDNIGHRKQVIILVLSSLIIIGNMGISIAFNYIKRYEKCNSVLKNDIDVIIPDNSLIFGSIRFYPFKMNGTWYCEVNRKKNVPNHYDYLILSSQDEVISGNQGLMKKVLDKKYEYEQIYLKQTKQYGVITIWRYKNLYEHTIQ